MSFSPVRIAVRAREFLQQGLSPTALAWSSTIGLLLGVLPVIGVSTLVMTFISWRFRLNLAIMLSISYLIYPLQLLLIIPYIRLGEWLLGAPQLPLSMPKLQQAFQSDFWSGLASLGVANLHAALAWLLLALPTGTALYLALLLIFKRFSLKKIKRG
jgi:uncharacterized protein (DUF2062 family)